jgi:hypothetical protein
MAKPENVVPKSRLYETKYNNKKRKIKKRRNLREKKNRSLRAKEKEKEPQKERCIQERRIATYRLTLRL